jgi:hypothetical protein
MVLLQNSHLDEANLIKVTRHPCFRIFFEFEESLRLFTASPVSIVAYQHKENLSFIRRGSKMKTLVTVFLSFIAYKSRNYAEIMIDIG